MAYKGGAVGILLKVESRPFFVFLFHIAFWSWKLEVVSKGETPLAQAGPSGTRRRHAHTVPCSRCNPV